MSDIEVRELDYSEYKLWDELVEKSPHGTIFHTCDWLTICKDSLNKDLKIYGCFQNDELVGGCSLFIINKFKGFFTIASSTCKMTPYGGIVLKESPSTRIREQESFQNNTLQAILKYIKNKNFDSVTLSNSPDFIDIRQFTYNKWTPDVKYAYYFDLSTDIEKKLSKKVRNIIRKASKNEVRIRKENNPELFNKLYKGTFEKQDLIPPVSLNFFENALDTLISKNSGEMWIAEMPSGEPLSAEIVVWDNKRAYRWSAASNNNLREIGSTSLLLFAIFNDLKSRDFKEINLMAANTPHLTKFISSFNPKLVSYYSVNCNSTTFVILKQMLGIIK